jgi:hypothetical protein
MDLSMTMLLMFRFVKVIAVACFATGCLGALMPGELRNRRRFVLWLAAPGLLLSWVFGFGIAGVSQVSLLSVWILAALPLSLLSFHAVLYATGKEGRHGWATGLITATSLAATFALMVFRPG